jgi:hypothetical protein
LERLASLRQGADGLLRGRLPPAVIGHSGEAGGFRCVSLRDQV